MRTALAPTLGLLVLTTLSCGDDDKGPTGPSEPASPTTGSIQVSLAMSGFDVDPDGCTVTVDGRSGQQLNVGATIAFSHLAAGTHEIAIGDVAANCQADGGASRSVTVVAGETTRETFEVLCDWKIRSSTGVPMVVLDDPSWLRGSRAEAINDLGEIAGGCVLETERCACVWTRKGLIMLPSPDPELPQGWAYGINNRGQVVGEVGNLSDYLPVLWEDGQGTILGTFGDHRGHEGRGTAINIRGQIVGHSGIPVFRFYAFLWEEGQMTQLGSPYGPSGSVWQQQPRDINDSGQIVGDEASWSTVTEHWPIMWYRDNAIDLGPPPTGNWWIATGINNRGQIVGCTDEGGLILRENGMVTMLPTSCSTACAADINDRGQAVGTCRGSDAHEHRAYLWEDGEEHDLGTLGQAGSYATAINIHGMVAGYLVEVGDGVARTIAVVWLTEFAGF